MALMFSQIMAMICKTIVRNLPTGGYLGGYLVRSRNDNTAHIYIQDEGDTFCANAKS